jgi:uncharacterized membrane protein
MEGVVLGYETEEGAIKGADQQRYHFSRSEWKSPREPAAGMKVDFLAEDGQAKEIYLVEQPFSSILTNVGSESPEKTMPMAVYLCYLGSFIYGFSMILGVVLAYVNRNSAEGQWYQSHYDYQISIFWKSLIGFVVSIPLLFVFGIGGLVMLATYIWVLVKTVKGWRWLSEGVAVPK